MDEQKELRKTPTSIRIGAPEYAIIEEIIETYSPPGVRLGSADAIKIALHFWKENYRLAETHSQAAR
jgi:hypothetical protein